GVAVDGDLRATLIAGGKSNLTYEIATDTARWVLRRPPVSGLTPSAHDMVREFRVVAGLHGTAVPVAEPIVLCEDESVLGAPFAMTGFVDGPVFRSQSDLEALGDADVTRCANELVRVLAELHAVDHEAVGLGDFGRPSGYLGRQVGLWAKQWSRVKNADIPDVERLHRALEEAMPEQSETTIVHGDYRIDNTVVDAHDPGMIRAVLDWELSTLGDPLSDAALMCVYRHPALELVLGWPAAWTSDRLPSADALAEQYARDSGRRIRHWGFYMALGYFKLAVIAAGIDHRHRAGATVGEGFEHVAEAVPELIAEGLRVLPVSG
ncbi:MAG: phosphotransferase family protein, partial [Tomitella sp.]|nr:phosphotransferase family protein [Tomitella sp.]